MKRLSVVLDLPTNVNNQLQALASEISREDSLPQKFYLILRTLEHVTERDFIQVKHALKDVTFSSFNIKITGINFFKVLTKSNMLYVTVKADRELYSLREHINSLLEQIGMREDARKFIPYISLSSLKNVPYQDIANFIRKHRSFYIGAFEIQQFCLCTHKSKESDFHLQSIYGDVHEHVDENKVNLEPLNQHLFQPPVKKTTYQPHFFVDA